MEHPMTGEVPVHNIGEIWCATLMEMNRRIGVNLALQLVVDALKLTPANPGFLDARDAILAALDNKLAAGQMTSAEHTTARRGTWAAFARFGMGPAAQSNGASLSGIVADFNVPADTTELSIRVDASPNLAIPDNQSAGVTSVLAVAQSGRIKKVVVSVNIEHTYIGDLVVSLTTPSGNAILLHDRTGASAHNLIKSYSSDGTPLAGVVGEQAQGDWKLKIVDTALADVGVLRNWSIEVSLEAATQVIHEETSPGLAIPDNDPTGVSSVIAIAQSGTLQGIKAGIDITHTFIGDLRVELFSPSGQQAILHNRAGGGQDNLITAYDSITTPSLASLVGSPAEGNWVLRVIDLEGRDVGKLNKWSLELTL